MVSLLQRRWGKSAGRMQLLEVIFLRFYSFTAAIPFAHWGQLERSFYSSPDLARQGWPSLGTQKEQKEQMLISLISVFCKCLFVEKSATFGDPRWQPQWSLANDPNDLHKESSQNPMRCLSAARYCGSWPCKAAVAVYLGMIWNWTVWKIHFKT